MKDAKTMRFDLDGTLIDTVSDVANALNHAL
jgi:phosphoglycolate phosphatase-like HAD superfamily hydrolase